MLVLTQISLATIDELFRYKDSGFELEPFPGYTNDQWGIKAHNRAWILEKGRFSRGQKIMEVGGAYSLLIEFIAKNYGVESWNADSFGMQTNEPLWKRWGDPKELPVKHPFIRYVFEDFGKFSKSFPDSSFDRIFTVSTLEHINHNERVNVLRDIHRCLGSGGSELHTIDIPIRSIRWTILAGIIDRIPIFEKKIGTLFPNGVRNWLDLFVQSGVRIDASRPSPFELLDRRTLVESPDVVYRFYPPNNSYKPYKPSASLLLIIEDV